MKQNDRGSNNNNDIDSYGVERLLYCQYKGPGPGIYQLKPVIGRDGHCLTKPKAPAHSIGLPYKWNPAEGPGPVYAYDSTLTTRGKKETPYYSISTRPREKGIEPLPGPGAYDGKPLSTGSPRIGIGLPVKSPFKNEAPPPNSYYIKSGIGTTSVAEQTTPQFLVRSRTFVGSPYYASYKAAVPGPAAYGTVENRITYPTVGPYTVKSRVKTTDHPLSPRTDAPGPGMYDPNDRTLSTRQVSSRRGGVMGVKHSPFQMPMITREDTFY